MTSARHDYHPALMELPTGAVVRWTASGAYTYVAVKVPAGGWFTTARDTNLRVPQVVSSSKLAEILGRSESTDPLVAAEWIDLGGVL